MQGIFKKIFIIFTFLSVLLIMTSKIVLCNTDFIADIIDHIKLNDISIMSNSGTKIDSGKLKILEKPTYSKLYVKGVNERREYYRTWENGVKNKYPTWISISTPEKKVKWYIFPNTRTYYPSKIDVSDRDYVITKIIPKLKYIASEKVAGFECKKYKGILKTKDETFQTTIWWSSDLKFALKKISKSSKNSIITELHNIHIKTLPNSLFELPKKYKQVKQHK